ncbi:cysteine desulfurase family protein [Spirosoma sordidisoli]|uniref:cysteine desulfurase n=1 Tax=Spirosoma sordidisoli TaxID=2502893 RepID=A0A4Q2UPD5_9BACT|nr:cysteine desulfurase family protein [Spirosoma sordidisoli]RYC71314.1 cysteine desulfurase [Spirosoma sordidisoli]
MDYIYLDNNATTRIAPEVLDAMIPYLSSYYANASSAHGFGKEINSAVKQARNQVAGLIDCEPNEIVFTAGATEAINLAIKGVAESYQSKGRHIVTVQTEHSAVLDVCRHLETRGYEVTYLPVSRDGLINLSQLRSVLRSDTILVAVMTVNNETGVQQPIRQIADLAHEVDAIFVSDATQIVGKLPLSVEDYAIDLMPFSAHKFYGPKGIGGLFVRQRLPRRVRLEAMTHGGGHERGLRSGTLNVPGIVGMGKACELAQASMVNNATQIGLLRDQLETSLLEINGAFVIGNRAERLFNVTNISFPGTDANVLIGQLKNIAVSNGSACSSAVFEPSHVLKAMGLTDEEALSAVRFSLSHYTTGAEIETVVRRFKTLLAGQSHLQ